MIEEHPIALQLRYLQTLLELGASQSTTIVFPAPIDLLKPFLERDELAAPEPRSPFRAPRRLRSGTRAAARAQAGRSSRADAEELESCPFCEGREDRTPPEVFALPAMRPDTRVGGCASSPTSTRRSSARRS